jgi:hypothetical protein
MVNAFGAKTPTYSTILELDRKIRDFPVPPHLQPRCDDEELTDAVVLVNVQRLLLLTNKETSGYLYSEPGDGTYLVFSFIEYSSTILHTSPTGSAE